MRPVLYATGNDHKFSQALTVCKPHQIELTQLHIDVPEIQAEDGVPIALDKAVKAFAITKKPVVVSDDNWLLPGLKGFPGPYMKSVNNWFTTDDWLRLTHSLTDRTIILRQILVYQDQTGHHLFSKDIEGILLTKARGTSPYPHSSITSFDGGHLSNAEYRERGESAAAKRPNVWHDFASWYTKRHDKTT